MNTYNINQASKLCGVEPYVLRYWESEFPQLAPKKDKRGHRLYCDDDIKLILKIKHLLYKEGYKIAAAKKLLEEKEKDNNINQTNDINQILERVKEKLKLLELLFD